MEGSGHEIRWILLCEQRDTCIRNRCIRYSNEEYDDFLVRSGVCAVLRLST